MRDFIWNRIQRLIGSLILGALILGLTFVARVILRSSKYDEAMLQHDAENIAVNVLAVAFLVGLIVMVCKELRERKNRRAALPPPLPSKPIGLRESLPMEPPSHVPSMYPEREQPRPTVVIPPPLPGSRQAPKKRSRGWLLAAGAVVLIPFIALAAIYVLASQYESQPKLLGERELRTTVYKKLMAYRDQEAFGNTPEAEKMAEEFARLFSLHRQVFFTQAKASAVSMSKGHFLTYCSIVGDQCAFVVHVPQLRKFSPDAKIAIGEIAWITATTQIQESQLELNQLAVGLRGVLDTDRVLLGKIDPTLKPLESVAQTITGPDADAALYPFFDWSKAEKVSAAPAEIKENAASAGSELEKGL